MTQSTKLNSSRRQDRAGIGRPRLALVGFGITVLTLVWGHALAALMRPAAGEASISATGLTLLAVVVGIAITGKWGGRIAARLPRQIDTTFEGRPLAALLWVAILLVAVFQVGRLATYMTDPESDWFLTTRNPFWAKHTCLPAYLYAAELNERGAVNIYDVAHYPGLNPEAAPVSHLDGMTPEDPYQYTPQFLLLPRLAIALSRDYATLHLFWFALQTTLFLGVASWLTIWVGGRHGLLAALLLPVAMSAFPVLHSLQYGQAHISVIALGVAGMLAFEGRKPALGGLLLGAATLSKLFPGVLLVVLAAQRRWRDLAWTVGSMAAVTVLALAVLGTTPFVAFFDYHLPRLSNGEAFAFDAAWPEIADFIVAANQGAFGLVEKLRALGVPGLDKAVAAKTATLFGLGVVALAAMFGLRAHGRSRDGVGGPELPRYLQAAGWLALLGLGSMTSNGAFGDYVPLTAVWMLTLLAARMVDGRRAAVLLGLCGFFQYTLIGTTPLGSWFDPEVMIPISLLALLSMIGAYGWVIVESLRFAGLPGLISAHELAGDFDVAEVEEDLFWPEAVPADRGPIRGHMT